MPMTVEETKHEASDLLLYYESYEEEYRTIAHVCTIQLMQRIATICTEGSVLRLIGKKEKSISRHMLTFCNKIASRPEDFEKFVADTIADAVINNHEICIEALRLLGIIQGAGSPYQIDPNFQTAIMLESEESDFATTMRTVTRFDRHAPTMVALNDYYIETIFSRAESGFLLEKTLPESIQAMSFYVCHYDAEPNNYGRALPIEL